MNLPIEAKYFDGKTSVAQQTTVIIQDRINELQLRFKGEKSIIWAFEEIEFERYDNLLEIRNKKYPSAILKIDNKEFSEKFYILMKKKNQVDIHTQLIHIGFAKITAIAVCLLGLIIFAYFYILPSVAEKTVAFLPESFDTEIGNVFMKTFLDENDIDSTKTKYLEVFASELNLKNSKPLRFAVVESNEVNAFALPNGQIVIYTGLLNKIKNTDELVALLGHEVSHVNCRHSMKMLSRNLAGYMIVSLLLSDVNGIMAVVADNAQQLHSLSYSRKFEQEADEQGLNILMENNIDPNGMINLFQRLKEQEYTAIPQIISTHPLTEERIKNMQKIISKTTYKIEKNNELETIFCKITKK